MLNNLNNLSRPQVITAWFVLVALVVAGSLAAGVTATAGTWAFVLLTSLIPPAISFVVWSGAPAPTVAEVLYAVRQDKTR